MSKQIKLTSNQILEVLEAMHEIVVFVDTFGALRVTCELCDHNLFVGVPLGSDIDEDEVRTFEEDLGADELFILAGEHCLPGKGVPSECDAMLSIGTMIDHTAIAYGIELLE